MGFLNVFFSFKCVKNIIFELFLGNVLGDLGSFFELFTYCCLFLVPILNHYYFL